MDIGISPKDTKEIITLMEKVLANQHLLYQKLRNYHWNITGQNFVELHQLFEELYTELFNDIDVVAERIRSFDTYTIGTLTQYLQLAEIKEEPNKVPSAKDMVKQLVKDHETFIRLLRTASQRCGELHDLGNEGLLTDLLTKHEKQAWLLRAHL